jgi:hypothetical protein
MWLYFELPFAFVTAASIIVFFEWIQIADFLKHTVDSDSKDVTPTRVSPNAMNSSLRGSFIAKATSKASQLETISQQSHFFVGSPSR